MKTTTFQRLGRVPAYGSNSEKPWRQRPVNLKAVMIYPASGFRSMQEMEVKVVRISEGESIFFFNRLPAMNDTFYLNFDVSKLPPVACWVIRKMSQSIYCRFHKEIETSTIERIIVENEMKNTLDSLWSIGDPVNGGGGSPVGS